MQHRIGAFVSPVIMMVFTVLTAALMSVNSAIASENQASGRSAGSASQPNRGAAYVVTPTNGPSWLKYLGIFELRFTAMGQMGGYDPAPPSSRQEPGFPIMEESTSRGPMGMGRGG